jgi:hypothetical protein
VADIKQISDIDWDFITYYISPHGDPNIIDIVQKSFCWNFDSNIHHPHSFHLETKKSIERIHSGIEGKFMLNEEKVFNGNQREANIHQENLEIIIIFNGINGISVHIHFK